MFIEYNRLLIANGAYEPMNTVVSDSEYSTCLTTLTELRILVIIVCYICLFLKNSDHFPLFYPLSLNN